MTAPISADAIPCGGLWQGRVWRGQAKKRLCTDNRAGFATEDEALAWAEARADALRAELRAAKEAGRQVRVHVEDETLYAWSDGACAGNPGPMGLGGVLRAASGAPLAMFSATAGRGTNNEAEYLAALRCIELAALVGARRLVLRADSELVVRQYSGEYAVNKPKLRALLGQLRAAARLFPGGVVIEWAPREQNADADALASRACGMPQAPMSRNGAVGFAPAAGFAPSPEALRGLPPAPACLRRFLALGKRGFGDFFALKTGGIDGYSRMSEEECRDAIEVRHGPGSFGWLRDALGERLGESYGKAALRWCARGLPPDLALKKASVDTEVALRARG